ncbi:porin [Brucella endophytica]|uniref:Porin n=1 Tax=Brucella endophytica TaxID=1963359 RepID=A0A916SBV4_9HYPH|nr:porin [Brucella endophytica]GGA93416.1 porin [Brucella endophytica]
MNIKCILLGFAAVLTAASSAGAADATHAAAAPEPEQNEYLRACYTTGAGYFFIPGTETCLRISGYIRFDAAAGDALGLHGVDRRRFYGSEPEERLRDTWNLSTRFALRTHTATATELGTLYTYTESRFQYDTTSVPYTIDGPDGSPVEERNSAWANFDTTTLNFAYIELGGLRLGKDETAFRTFLGYAGNVVNDDALEPYGYDTMLISYTFKGSNGLSAILSLEQGAEDYTIDSYMPHVVGGLKYTQGRGSIGAVVGYDANFEEYAVKLRADYNISDSLSVFAMGGWRSDGDIEHRNHNFYASWGGDWIGWVGASYAVSDKAVANLQVSFDDAKELAVAVNLAYELVPGFTVTPEVVYLKESESLNGNDDGVWGGVIRFQRSF